MCRCQGRHMPTSDNRSGWQPKLSETRSGGRPGAFPPAASMNFSPSVPFRSQHRHGETGRTASGIREMAVRARILPAGGICPADTTAGCTAPPPTVERVASTVRLNLGLHGDRPAGDGRAGRHRVGRRPRPGPDGDARWGRESALLTGHLFFSLPVNGLAITGARRRRCKRGYEECDSSTISCVRACTALAGGIDGARRTTWTPGTHWIARRPYHVVHARFSTLAGRGPAGGSGSDHRLRPWTGRRAGRAG